MKERILAYLEKDARMTPADIATMLGANEEEVKKIIEECEAEGTILGYRTVVNWEKTGKSGVVALIELKTVPQRDKGFDSVAERICNFPEVKSVALMSGGFDFTVLIEGKTMKEVAYFVARKLAPIEFVTATATHFVLKTYKYNGVIYNSPKKDLRESDCI